MNFIFVSWQLLFLTEIVTSQEDCMKAIRSISKQRELKVRDVQKFGVCLNRQNDEDWEKKLTEIKKDHQQEIDDLISYEYPEEKKCFDITQDPTEIANYNKCDDQETDSECILRLQGMLQKFSDMDQNLLDRNDENRDQYQNRLRNMVVYTRQKSDFYSKLYERCDKEERMV